MKPRIYAGCWIGALAAGCLLFAPGCAHKEAPKAPQIPWNEPPIASNFDAFVQAPETIKMDDNSVQWMGAALEPGYEEPPKQIQKIQKSSPLPSGFFNPMPGGVFAGYRADTGLDIAGSPRPVYAIAAGTLDYSEPGHTLWTGRGDTPNCVRIRLSKPIPWKGRSITHVYYAHLSELEYLQPEGSNERRNIEAGERLGMSGKARGSPHLHIGLLLDGEVEQYLGTFLLEDEIRVLLGGYKNGKSLPK